MQLTSTLVAGSRTRSSKQRSRSAPGASMPPGMQPLRYSARGRLSKTIQSSPELRAFLKSSGEN